MNLNKARLLILIVLMIFSFGQIRSQALTYPETKWKIKEPAIFGMDERKLDSIAELLEGRGCIVKDGYVIKSWGDQEDKSDWLSSVKPLFSTFLFFAIDEGKIPDVHYEIKNLGWELNPKDQSITFFHLANMISGYARLEKPGKAWAYNDFAIQLYHICLFDSLFHESTEEILYSRLGVLQFEDFPTFRKDKPRLYASVRDFARIGWFWLNHGKWSDRQLLPECYFDEYMKPHVPKDLPHTQDSETNDYLQIGTFGGGSDHFTAYGAGIYGFNWWFNTTGRLHPDRITWPDAPEDTFMSIGAGGNNMVMIPGLGIVLSSAKGNWGRLDPGNADSHFNRVLKLLVGEEGE